MIEEITLTPPPVRQECLLEDLRHLIDQTRKSVATTINMGLTMAYWHVGNRISKETLQDERAEYGQKIVATVSRELAREYGNSFNEKNLRRMIQFAQVFPDEKIVVSLIRQLTWTPDLVFRDPYILEFLNLNDRYVEKDVEDARHFH